MSDCVVLPSNHIKRHFSKELEKFFSDNQISIEEDRLFDMNCLRRLYKENRNLFEKIKLELSLFGFRFHSSVSQTFFPKETSENDFFIVSESDDVLTPQELTSLHLWGVVRLLGLSKKSDLSGFSFERLAQQTGFDQKSEFEKCGFGFVPLELIHKESRPIHTEKQKHTSEPEKATKEDPDENSLPFFSFFNALNERKKPDFQYEDTAEGTIWVPLCLIDLLDSLLTIDLETSNLFGEHGVQNISDFFSLDKRKIAILLDALFNDAPNHAVFEKWERSLRGFSEKKNKLEVDQEFSADSWKIAFSSQKASESLLPPLSPDGGFSFYVSQNNGLSRKFINPKFPLIDSQNEITSYLGFFGINSLAFFMAPLFTRKISDFIFDPPFLAPMLNPGKVIRLLLAEAGNSSNFDPLSADHEFEKLKAIEAVPNYLKNIRLSFEINASSKRQFSLIEQRESGSTLEECAKGQTVTRERVRQIVEKYRRRTEHEYKKLSESLFSVFPYLPGDFAYQIFGFSTAIESRKAEINLCLNEDLNIVLPVDKSAQVTSLLAYLKEKGSISPTDLQKLSDKLIVPLFYWARDKSVTSPKSLESEFLLKRNTQIDIIGDYLFRKGEAGIDLIKDIPEAAKYIESRTGKKITSPRVISGPVLRSDVVLRGMSRYCLSKFVTEKQIHTTREVLEASEVRRKSFGISAISLFEKNKSLLLASGIDNAYFLYGIASKFSIGQFVYSGRGLRIFPKKKIPLPQIISDYISENGPIVKATDLYKDLEVTETALEQIKEVTKYDSNTYVLTSWLNLDNAEIKHVSSFIELSIKEKGFCMAKDIIKSQIFFDAKYNAFLKRNRVGTSSTRLTYLLDNVFNKNSIETYHFSHHIDCISRSDAPIETKEDLLNYHFSNKHFRKEELEKFLEDYDLSTWSKSGPCYLEVAQYIDDGMLSLKRDIQANKKELIELDELANARYHEEFIISANDVLIRANIANISCSYFGNPIGLATAFSKHADLHWVTPTNDLPFDDQARQRLLANKGLFEKENISFSEAIRTLVFNRFDGYVSQNQINDFLLKHNIITRRLTSDSFANIFAKSYQDGLVEVKR
jgi:hypothetical protein